ncbi:hypothetical protein NPIL_537121, partial [Nephila pilipes]
YGVRNSIKVEHKRETSKYQDNIGVWMDSCVWSHFDLSFWPLPQESRYCSIFVL